MKMNAKKILNNLDKLNLQLKNDILITAMAQAGFNLMRDAVMEQPTIPKKEGTLRASGSVFVGSKLTGTSENLSTKKGTPNLSYKDKGTATEIIATVGYNTPYAARLHEVQMINYTEKSSGWKYLQSKMERYKEQYFNTITKYIKKRLGI